MSAPVLMTYRAAMTTLGLSSTLGVQNLEAANYGRDRPVRDPDVVADLARRPYADEVALARRVAPARILIIQQGKHTRAPHDGRDGGWRSWLGADLSAPAAEQRLALCGWWDIAEPDQVAGMVGVVAGFVGVIGQVLPAQGRPGYRRAAGGRMRFALSTPDPVTDVGQVLLDLVGQRIVPRRGPLLFTLGQSRNPQP